MSDKRIKFSTIVKNQVPSYVREEFPLVSEFLSQYYISQEFKGSPIDLIQNIDQYIKLEENSKIVESTTLSKDIESFDTVIEVNLETGTEGFPKNYGIIKIDSEIIVYTEKTDSSFLGCFRGFSGISSYENTGNNNLLFSETESDFHSSGSTVTNLSDLFLKEFLKKVKHQFLPGLENRELYSDLNESTFIKQAKDFYSTRGTDESFKILFKALYNKDVKVIRPKEYLFRPSDSNYKVSNNLVVEAVEGNPLDLSLSTLYQDEYGDIPGGYAPVTKVEKIYSDTGEYYQLSIDAGYNRDIQNEGSVYGRFSTHSKTRVVGNVSPQSTVIDVDSTVGFPDSGELYVTYEDLSIGSVSYNSKSINQFFECSNIEKTILDKTSVGINTYAYGYSSTNPDEIVRVRINSVLSDVEIENDVYGMSSNDPIEISNLGLNENDIRLNNWIYNVPSTYNVKSITLLDESSYTYTVETKKENLLHLNDYINLVDDNGDKKLAKVVKILGNKTFNISEQGFLDTSISYKIKRVLKKGNSDNYQYISNFNADVQNIYKNNSDEILIASSSIPSFEINPTDTKLFIKGGVYTGKTLNISDKDHGFYTGDAVYYTPEKKVTTTLVDGNIESDTVDVSPLFPEGLYYVKRVDSNNIKLAKSRANIEKSEKDPNVDLYINIENLISINSNSHKLEKYELSGKTLSHQKLFKKIQHPLNDGKLYPTSPGKTGILVNGVEVLNYKSNDSIYYGNIESIEVTSEGFDYDVINPPRVEIEDTISPGGSGASAYCSVLGSLTEIRIIDPGFDYQETPVISITGGNGNGAVAKANLKLVDHKSNFYADSGNAQVNLSSSSIGFTTYHKFRNGENVIYNSEGETEVGGLTKGAQYYISVQDLYTIKLHKKYEDSISGINTITLSSYGSGKQNFSSVNKKSVLSSINILNPGSGYQNKKRTVSNSGINTFNSTITILNHQYNDGEVIVYNNSNTPISGLQDGSKYYVTTIDENNFKLSELGTGNNSSSFFYDTKQYIKLSSVGTGTHSFNYPPISVDIVGSIGIASTSDSTFKAQVQPIFRGTITSIHIEDGGTGYGSEDVLNYERTPNVFLRDGKNAQVIPVINTGSITEVLILNGGTGYSASPDIEIIGDGSGAILTPIIKNGKLISVKVIEGGSNYIQGETFINLTSPGSGVDLRPKIKKWTVNLFSKYLKNIPTNSEDNDSILSLSDDGKSLQCSYLYAPRKLRESINPLGSDGNLIYSKSDLPKNQGKNEIVSTAHSPIIGWAYDGNPIYGPYGYANPAGGSSITNLKSGYRLDLKPNRPSVELFDEGFFVEDYTFFKNNDESYLDQNNGRFCVTPDFPNGVYAYFATIDTESSQTDGPFAKYKIPVFPYLIGENYYSSPIQENFEGLNQNSYNLNETDWIRNIKPYNLKEDDFVYEYINIPNKLSQKSSIKFAQSGSIETIGILTGGSGYKINDSLVFNESGTGGTNLEASVSLIEGKSVSSISISNNTVSDVEIYPDNFEKYLIVSNNPHNLTNGETVSLSGFNTTSSLLEGFYKIGVSSETFSLKSGISSVSDTGYVADFYISGYLESIRENDILSIKSLGGTEEIKVLNVDIKKSKVRALRAINGIGVSHSATDIVSNNNRRFTIDSTSKTSYSKKVNKEIYFNPSLSVAVGTISTTYSLILDPINDGSKIGIGTGSKSTIYFVNQKDYQKYNKGGYVDIFDATDSSFNTTKKKIVSVGSTSIIIDFDTSSLSGVGVTAYLNLRESINIPTKTIYLPNHGLETGDTLTYSTNDSGSPLLVSYDGTSIFTLTNNSTVYVAKIDDNLIGISGVKVGLGSTGTYVGVASTTSSLSTFYFAGVGVGSYHSFKTNYVTLTGDVSKNIVTVSTASSSQLSTNDTVYIEVNPSIASTFKVKYNDAARKFVINPKDFISSDVNTTTSTITIANHEFTSGQKVLHSAQNPVSGGLEDNKEYYVYVVDKNNIRLSDSYYNSTKEDPNIVSFASTDGTISAINPLINVYKNSNVTFDLSDSSLSYTYLSNQYPAFGFDIFIDNEFKEKFSSTKTSTSFAVSKVGTIGISSDAKLILNVTKDFPQNLYYNLYPLSGNGIPQKKLDIVIDDELKSNNKIQVKESGYNGKHKVISAGITSFTYQLFQYPENNSYSTNNGSIITYKTESLTSNGPIANVKILNGGSNYFSLPEVSDITSENGTGAELEAISSSIGKPTKIEIKNIGYDYPSDFTIRPTFVYPQLVKIESFYGIDSVGVTSFGKGYVTAPKLLVLDGKTNEVVPDIDLEYKLGSSEIKILKNTNSLNKATPTILPIENSNGVSVTNVGFNSLTSVVNVVLGSEFSDSFPFAVGDKVFVEGISIGIGSTSRGYNSKDYGYNLFTVVSVNENLGGIGSVSYSLSNYLNPGENPGTFDTVNSFGRIINQKDFPTFNVELISGQYVSGETVKIGINSIPGTVVKWDENSSILKISSKEKILPGSTIEGLTSKVISIASNVTSFDSYINLSSSSKLENGWSESVGTLNDNFQVLQDGEYYQNFAYSIKSTVDFNTWNDPVSTLNHTAGFKKFSEYDLESTSLPASIGISTSHIEVVGDNVSIVDLNCYPDFDLVGENYLNLDSTLASDEILFSNKILLDYLESVGNRVLSIDNISNDFNSNPRPIRYSEVNKFLLSNARVQKYITSVRDKRYTSQRQLMLVTLLQANSTAYLNQYARMETTYDLGSFDFSVDGSEGILLFYPTKYSVNDYDVTTLSYKLKDGLLGFGTTSFGDSALLETYSTDVSGQTTILGISTSYKSAKVLVEIDSDNSMYEFDELNIIHDGTNVDLLEYGQLTSYSVPTSGLGTYNAYISGSEVKVDFIPNVGSGTTLNVNSFFIALSDENYVGVGSTNLNHAHLEVTSTNISSSASPSPTVVAEYKSSKSSSTDTDPIYIGSYGIVQIIDKTNNECQISEIATVDFDGSATVGVATTSYITQFGTLVTNIELGEIGVNVNDTNTEIIFTPLPNIDVNVKVYFNSLTYNQSESEISDIIDFTNGSIETQYGSYTGTDSDIKKQFNLTHNNYEIFGRSFEADDSEIVNIDSNTITIPNHFFVTGEKVIYNNYGIGTNTSNSIGIATTSIIGYGSTDKLPSEVYIVKVNQNAIKLSGSAEDALKNNPITFDITSVGIGSLHSLTSTNQNAKVLISIDNIIQSPVVSTAITTNLQYAMFTADDIAYFSDVSSFYGGDLIRIGSEIMKIESVGIGSTNRVKLSRPLLGTEVASYSTGALITKVKGDYNIVDNNINFISAPYGNLPFSSDLNPPDERDWVGIETSSSFSGRVFLRSGQVGSSSETYSKNYIFDDVSNQFNSIESEFTLTSSQNNVAGFSTEGAIVLINNIFQTPGSESDYVLNENVGITTLKFVGVPKNITSDVGISSFPRGGIIVSVGSTSGFGYQPLVAAGGTAVVSGLGTISSISIGNSGSGYRSGIQTVRVGVKTTSSSIEFIGTATISGGNIVSIAITNPGFGYTSTNPPSVVFDDPLSYSNIPLVYSSSSVSGFGSNASVDIVVGQGSSVIDFEINNTGYGYKIGEILTIPFGGLTGIPTTTSFNPNNEFRITIQDTYNDKFSAWNIGELQLIDSIENLFDGKRVSFPTKVNNDLIAIRSSQGSNVNVQDTLLVFVNNILQVPGSGYVFPGGSTITFTEAPKEGDTATILFYKGSRNIDVVEKNILETVKIGDELTIGYDSTIGQSPNLQENSRTISEILSTESVKTITYFGPGNVSDTTLRRPVNWCKQKEDKIINGQYISKDRLLYEPSINPVGYLIQPVTSNSTTVYVDTVKPFFNLNNEKSGSREFQNKITLISQDNKVSSSATSVVSYAGTVSSIVISDGGVGYTTSPSVIISSPVGFGTTAFQNTAIASATISGGTVTEISVTSGGSGYTQENPPLVIIESPSFSIESSTVSTYSGDFGLVVGFGTTVVPGSHTHMIMDLYIPNDSILRKSELVGTALTVSGIGSGDYFVVHDSIIGIATTSVTSLSITNSNIGIGTEFIDNVYQVESSQILQRSIAGVGSTYVNRIRARVSYFPFNGFNPLNFDDTSVTYDSTVYSFDNSLGISTDFVNTKNFGKFTWGKIQLDTREKQNSYNSYTNNGVGGLSTSTIVRRTNPLKFKDYTS